MSDYNQSFGQGRKNTLKSNDERIEALLTQKKYNKVEKLLRRAVSEQGQALGQDHECTITSRYRLGKILLEQKKYEEAEAMLRQAANGLEQTLGQDYTDTINCKVGLGVALFRQNKYSEAEELLRHTIRVQDQALGEDDKTTLYCKLWLGMALVEQTKYREAEEVLRQTISKQEQYLGQNHPDTRYSKHQLGRAVFEQGKHSEAEELLNQSIGVGEKTFGQDNKDTLSSKHLLGRALFEQKKYTKAEEILRQAVRGRENTLGQNHKDTLNCKQHLVETLFIQKKYSEAVKVLRQLFHGQQQTLGQDHEDTLNCNHQLAVVLFEQKKYIDAEEVLKQYIGGAERTFGKDHVDTLRGKYRLGAALFEQKKYSEAEEMLRQSLRGREQILGQEHKATLNNKYRLGEALFEQKKYIDAEEVLRQCIGGAERTFGEDHTYTLRSKYQLGAALFKQKKYSEAKEVLQQAMRGQEQTLGPDHEETHATMQLLLELQLHHSSSLATNNTIQQALANRLGRFFEKERNTQEPFTDADIIEIVLLLSHLNRRWSRLPRTYVVLRTIGHLGLLDKLIDVGFSDYWFPITERNLPDCVLPTVRASFVRSQALVLTKSMDLEKGEKGQHCFYKPGESPPFETKGILGTGGFGQVDRVLSLISFREYARKLIPRGLAYRARRTADIKMYIAEIEILKRLKHRHIVELIGSYTDSRYMALVMSPVAEMDLGTYLTRATFSNHPELRTFFGCLATALEYLHEQKIRHKDIKPSNVLINRGSILLTDFGLSFDFTESDGSTTTSVVNGMSPRYCAPEVAQYQPRNTKSDVWSLGVVFMEMVTVLKGRTVQNMNEFLRQRGSHDTFIRTNLEGLLEFVTELEVIGTPFDNRILGWTQQMLSIEQQLRPTASSLVASIIAAGEEEGSPRFCGICCVSEEECFSDCMDE